MNLTPLMPIIGKLFLLAVFVRLVWSVWRPTRSWGRRMVGWLICFILAFCGFIALAAGPGVKILDLLSPDAVMVAVVALALPMVLGFLELGFRRFEGPFPKLPHAVEPVKTHRRRLYPWMDGAAALVLLMAGMVRIAPASWHDNLLIATFLVGLFSCMVLWFQYYKARRYDYGRTALQSSPNFHWVYTAGELDAWKDLEPGVAAETWMGPDGLLFAGEYAPWALYICHLVRACGNLGHAYSTVEIFLHCPAGLLVFESNLPGTGAGHPAQLGIFLQGGRSEPGEFFLRYPTAAALKSGW